VRTATVAIRKWLYHRIELDQGFLVGIESFHDYLSGKEYGKKFKHNNKVS